MRRLLLHVGYPKAASTSLQNGLFRALHNAKAIHFLGRAFETGFYGIRRNKGDYKDWFDSVVDRKAYDTNNSLGPLSDNVTNVLSEGLFMMNERHFDHMVGPEILSRYFSGLADQIDVMIIIRKQNDLLPSYFVQNYRKLDKRDFNDFLNHNRQTGWTGEAKIFNYHEVIRSYAAAFGKDRVHVVLFEDFVRDRERFSADLAQLIHVDPAVIKSHMGEEHLNQSRKEAGTIFIRKLDKSTMRYRAIRFFEVLGLKSVADRFRVKIPAVSDAEKRTVSEIFKDSNLKLAEEFGLDKDRMRRYGYF